MNNKLAIGPNENPMQYATVCMAAYVVTSFSLHVRPISQYTTLLNPAPIPAKERPTKGKREENGTE